MSAPEIFHQEAEELLEQLEHALLDLEVRPGDAGLVATIFRALHTIKGSASVFGLDGLSAFTHRLESVFNQIRNGAVAATPALIGVALAAKDHMRGLMAGTAPPEAGEAILVRLAKAVVSGGAIEAAAVAAPAQTYRIRFVLPENAFAIGTDPAALIADLLALGQGSVIGPPPPLVQPDEASYRREWEVRLTTSRSVADIEDVFLFIRDSTRIAIEPVAPPAEAAPPRKRAKPLESVIRVGSNRIDNLIDQVGELVIAEARLRQLTHGRDDPDLLLVAEEVERLTAGLRDTAMAIRMVPIGSLFARFRRPVHDLARELGKEVRLATLGEDTELDKAMVENLYDPLLHLIRNAVDHGIEDGNTRRAAGKPAEGIVTLSATHVGAEVLISVSDDGKGLDRRLIQAKAIALGIIPADSDPPDAELYACMFHPGFSTAAEVSNVSGRGVGLDVVKTAIETQRGLIDVTTRPGLGTIVALRMPLTLAIIDGLLVRVGDQRYVIPMAMVEECVQIPEGRQDGDSKFLTLRDELVPFLRLREVFATEGSGPASEMAVVVTAAERRVGLAVDQLLGGHQTVVKSLSRLHRGVRCVSGATILGDGRIALILDVLNLIALRQGQEASERYEKGGEHVD